MRLYHTPRVSVTWILHRHTSWPRVPNDQYARGRACPRLERDGPLPSLAFQQVYCESGRPRLVHFTCGYLALSPVACVVEDMSDFTLVLGCDPEKRISLPNPHGLLLSRPVNVSREEPSQEGNQSELCSSRSTPVASCIAQSTMRTSTQTPGCSPRQSSLSRSCNRLLRTAGHQSFLRSVPDRLMKCMRAWL